MMAILFSSQQRPWGFLYRHQELIAINRSRWINRCINGLELLPKRDQSCVSVTKSEPLSSDRSDILLLPRCTVRASRTTRIFFGSLQVWASFNLF